MGKTRVVLCSFYLLSVGLVLPAQTADLTWPLSGNIDLSNGFGDYRDGRFHTGVDLRTGGAVGLPVNSPVDGYVWRLKLSYGGYGKGLYVKGADGFVYVFGHLSAFAPAIDTVVKRAQYQSERYSVDLLLPADSLPVKKGAIIAYSGESGAGAPHLHFEKRLTDEYPLNPLTHGFKLADKVRPTLSRVGFQLVDDHSLFENGQRKWFMPVRPGRGAGKFVLDSVPYFNAPFGILLDGDDRTRADGMKQAIPFLRLEIDGRPTYESRFDTLAFATGKSVYFEYDYEQATAGDKTVRRLFHLSSNAFAGSRGINGSDGVIRLSSTQVGRHTARVIAQDSYGNTSALSFDFIAGPVGPLLPMDSVLRTGLDTARFYFSADPGYAALSIDSTVVEFNVTDKWGPTPNAVFRRLHDGKFMVEVIARANLTAILRLVHHSRFGSRITDEPFNGLAARASKKITVEHEIVEDGLIVTYRAVGQFGSLQRLDLYGPSGRLGHVFPARFFDMRNYRFFVQPRPEYSRIDSFMVVMDTDLTALPFEATPCRLWAVGNAEADTLQVDTLFRVVVKKTDLFGPLFIELQKLVLPNRGKLKMVTDAYKLLPEEFPTRGEIDLRLVLLIPNSMNYKGGICKFDFKNERWKWRPDNSFSNNIITATNASGGIFAAFFDLYAPVISDLSIKPREIIGDGRPLIRFNVRDTLAGIADDKSFEIRLDRKWMIPEYDPETGVCTFQPPELLSNGDHHLAIKVTDRVDNLAEQYLIFTVSSREGAKRKQ